MFETWIVATRAVPQGHSFCTVKYCSIILPWDKQWDIYNSVAPTHVFYYPQSI